MAYSLLLAAAHSSAPLLGILSLLKLAGDVYSAVVVSLVSFELSARSDAKELFCGLEGRPSIALYLNSQLC